MHPFETLIPDLTERAYNALPGLRSTELKPAFRSALHWKHYQDTPSEQTDAMRFGSALHAAVLLPEVYVATRCIAPKGKSSKAEKQAQADFAATLQPHSLVVTQQEHETILRMVENVHNHPVIGPLLERGAAEQTMLWHDKEYGVDCKLRADFITTEGCVLDIKTAVSAELQDFTRQVVNSKFMYHVSAAHYLAGLTQAKLTGGQFGYVVIEKTPPYAVALYEAPEDMIELGAKIRGHAILNIKEAKRRGVYAGYPEEFIVMETPAYAKNVVDVGK